MASASVEEFFAIILAEQGKGEVPVHGLPLRCVEQTLRMRRAKRTFDFLQQPPTLCVVGNRKYLKAVNQKQTSF